MIIPLSIAILAGGGVYLVMQRSMLRIIVGMTLFSHATNLFIMSTGTTTWRGEPFPSLTTYMLTLSGLGSSDDTTAHAVADEDSPLQTLGRSTTMAELAAADAQAAKQEQVAYRRAQEAQRKEGH